MSTHIKLVEKLCPGSDQPVSNEYNTRCSVCDEPVTAYPARLSGVALTWFVNKHYQKPQGHCDCGNPIYEVDYLCEICRSTYQ